LNAVDNSCFWIELGAYLIAEIGSSSAPASAVSVSVGQQPLNVSVSKEVVVNGENGYSQGNGKQSSNHEDRDLKEWYKT
jgi:hypothetical protein